MIWIVVSVLFLVLVGCGALFGWILARRPGTGESDPGVDIGVLALNEEVVDLLAEMHDAVHLVQEYANAKVITLKLALPENLPALYVDGEKIKQMLSSLLSNAIDSTPKGGWVVVTAERDGRGGLTIVVADTGGGIAPEQVSHVKHLIEQHGGEFQLRSVDGRGATVTLSFPPERLGADTIRSRI
jgi:signal transduction histidine kinase